MVPAQIKNLQVTEPGNLVRDGAPDEVVAEVQSVQGSALRELQRNGLVEDVVSKVEVGQIAKLAYRSRDFTGQVHGLKVERGDVEWRVSGARNAGPVTVVSGGGRGRGLGRPGGQRVVRVFDGGLEGEESVGFRGGRAEHEDVQSHGEEERECAGCGHWRQL